MNNGVSNGELTGLFLGLSYLSSGIAMIALVLISMVCVIATLRKRSVCLAQDMKKNLRFCKISSVIFILCGWIIVAPQLSIGSNSFDTITVACMNLGGIWFLTGFFNIIVTLFAGIKREEKIIEVLNQYRGSSFIMGAVFCLLSFLLK